MTDHNPTISSISRFFVVAAAIMVILASVKAASVIVVPFLLALFIAIVFQPAIFWFKQKGLPPSIAIGAVFVVILVVGSAFVGLVLQSVNEFTLKMPEYREKILDQFETLVAYAETFNIHLDIAILQDQFDPSRLFTMSVNLLSGLGNMMTNTVIIMLIVAFMLSEAALMPKKIALAFPSPEKKLGQMTNLLMAINKYLALKTVVSLITGCLVGFGLWLMGLDHFILWAVIAFLFNYIPNIGSIIAAVPAVLMFAEFIDEPSVRLTGVEPAGRGIESGEHGATLSAGKPGVLHGCRSFLMQDSDGQIEESYSVSAGLDYPGVGPQHAYLHSIGRAQYTRVTDQQALDAFKILSSAEGIIPALETAHALAYAIERAKAATTPEVLLVNLSGRGDKDIDHVRKILAAQAAEAQS